MCAVNFRFMCLFGAKIAGLQDYSLTFDSFNLSGFALIRGLLLPNSRNQIFLLYLNGLLSVKRFYKIDMNNKRNSSMNEYPLIKNANIGQNC